MPHHSDNKQLQGLSSPKAHQTDRSVRLQLFAELQPLHLFLTEGRASYLHSTDFGRDNKLRDIRDGAAPLLNGPEELFKSARTSGRNDHGEMKVLIINGSPCAGDASGKRTDNSCMQYATPSVSLHRN